MQRNCISVKRIIGAKNSCVINNTPGNVVNVDAQIVLSSQSPGLNTITLIAVDDGVPPASDTIRISFKIDTFAFQPPSPIIGSHFYCNNPGATGVMLHVDSSYQTYLWSTGTIGIDSLQVLSGTYNCEVTNINGCKAKTPAFPVWAILPTPVITGITAFCGSDSAHLVTTPTNFSHYQWLESGTPTGDTLSTLDLGPSNNGNYSVLVTDTIGCKDTSAVLNVDLHPLPNAQFTFYPPSHAVGGDTIIFFDQSIAGSGTITAWHWDFGDSGPNSTSNSQNAFHVYDSTGVYIVSLTVTQSDGCTKSYSLSYRVESDALIPSNIITPNGDHKNDVFKFENLEYFPESKLQVFNRWGKKIYENNNYDNKWNGGDAKEGTYYYILQIPDKDAIKGTLTIKR